VGAGVRRGAMAEVAGGGRVMPERVRGRGFRRTQ